MAATTFDEFVARFPEFRNAGQVLVEKALAEAALYVDAAAFGARYDLAVETKAASLLMGARYGQTQPLPSKDQTNEYEKRFAALKLMVPRRGMVT